MALCPSAPKGYNIEDNPLWTAQQRIIRQAKQVAAGDYIAAMFAGPGGLGKTWLARRYLKGTDKRVVQVNPDAMHMAAVLRKYRDPNTILVFDDSDTLLLNGTTGLNLLKDAVDPEPRKKRLIVWERKNGEFLRFNFEGAIIFCTNIRIDDPNSFDKAQRAHVEPVLQRFQLTTNLYDHATDAHMYNLSCWVMSDGSRVMRDLTHERTGKQLTVAEQNEVLRFFHENVLQLKSLSPRTLLAIARYRLKSPDAWQDEAKDLFMKTERSLATSQTKLWQVNP